MPAIELFPDLPREVQPSQGPRPARPRLVAETDCWTVEDHVCMRCFGRILSAAGPGGRIFLCSDCGHREEGPETVRRTAGRAHPVMCACSMRYGTADAGVRCQVNAQVSPALPQAIVAVQGG
jgi:hypothetical protein